MSACMYINIQKYEHRNYSKLEYEAEFWKVGYLFMQDVFYRPGITPENITTAVFIKYCL